MKWTDAGLLLLILSGVAGLITVLASPAPPIQRGEPNLPDGPSAPLDLLEREFATICYGETFKTSGAAGDTLLRSMDLLRDISVDQANLHITRSLARLGFQHHVTYADQALGLSFICTTPGGEPARLALITADR